MLGIKRGQPLPTSYLNDNVRIPQISIEMSGLPVCLPGLKSTETAQFMLVCQKRGLTLTWYVLRAKDSHVYILGGATAEGFNQIQQIQ